MLAPEAVFRRWPNIGEVLHITILVQLQKKGRISNVNLADAVGLSPSPCLQRVKRLETAGFITGYKAHVNLPEITNSITVFTELTLAGHRREDFMRFENVLREVDERIGCYLITGGYDYLLRFITRSIEHYQEVIESVLDAKVGVDKYFSYIVIKLPLLKKSVPLRLFISRQTRES